MPDLASYRVAVIGGGIGGLTNALAFARRGAKVFLFEQAAALTEVGAGLQITPNGARVLDTLGLADVCAARGVQAQAVVPMDGLTGRTVTRFDLSQQRPAYRFFHRAVLLDILAEAARVAGVTIVLGQRVTAPPEGFDLIVGAEGLHSGLRQKLNGSSAPFFTGQIAWRAIAQLQAPAEARIWMLPGAHVVSYPLDKDRLNIVAVQERAAWADEGWHHADEPANLQNAFSHGCSELRAILDAVDDVSLWGLFRHPVAENWVTDDVALIGDAAHPTLPFLAQGANMAIEDAYALARYCADADFLPDGLQRYQSLRKPRVTRAIRAANANAVNYHLRGLRRTASLAALRGIGCVAPNAFLNRLSWLYDHDVTA